MDTRFWGPDGWKLLHSIARGFPDNPTKNQKDAYCLFFTCLKHILPCIYCRNSYTQYIRELPLTDKYLKDNKTLSLWIYKIHNKVNNKLRKQGLLNEDDPKFSEIFERYTEFNRKIEESNCKCSFPGWDFMHCVVFNFPLKECGIEVIRQTNYIIFFSLLSEVIPFQPLKKLINDYICKNDLYSAITGRIALKKWLYGMEKSVLNELNVECLTYRERCERIENNRAGCGSKKDKKPTCRKSRKSNKNNIK